LRLEKKVYDTIFSKRFDGIDCRVIDAPGARRQKRAGLNLIQLLKALPNSVFIAEQMHMPYIKMFFGVLFSGWKNSSQLAYMANAFDSLSKATVEGDLQKGWLTVGQVTGLVSVNVLGLDHRVIARTIVARIEDPFVRLALDALGLVIYQASDTRDLTAPDEGNPLGRSQIDFNFRYLEKMTVHAGAIKEVAATGMLVAGAHIISWEDTIDADDPTGLGDD